MNKKWIIIIAIVLLILVCLCLVTAGILFLPGLLNSTSADIISVQYAESINYSGGVSVVYEGMDIIEIVMSFTFDPEIVSDLDPDSEDYRSELFLLIDEGITLYLDDEEVERTYGYWPEEADETSATNMTLFYLVPDSHDPDDLRFVFDGEVIGSDSASIDTGLNP